VYSSNIYINIRVKLQLNVNANMNVNANIDVNVNVNVNLQTTQSDEWTRIFQSLHPLFEGRAIHVEMYKVITRYHKKYKNIPNLQQLTDFIMTRLQNHYNELADKFPSLNLFEIKFVCKSLIIMCGYMPALNHVYATLRIYIQHERVMPTYNDIVTMRSMCNSNSNSMRTNDYQYDNNNNNNNNNDAGLMSRNSDKFIVNNETLIKHRIQYDCVRSLPNNRHEHACAICQEDFKVGDEIATLPCSHIFHSATCIDPWIKHNNNACPMCRGLIYQYQYRKDPIHLFNSCTKLYDEQMSDE
jgi:hypothetical protein